MRELHTVKDVIHALGGRKAASELAGVTIRGVAEWRTQNAFPSRLYFLINERLETIGCVADRALFNFAEHSKHEAAE